MLNILATTATSGFNTQQLYIDLVVLVVGLVALWKVFVKANEPGWKAIIPIYDVFVLYKIAGKPWYWVLLSLIPIANIYFIGYMYVGLGKKFGKGTAWSIILLFFLEPIGLLVLAFDKSNYGGTPDGVLLASSESLNQQSSQSIQSNTPQSPQSLTYLRIPLILSNPRIILKFHYQTLSLKVLLPRINHPLIPSSLFE